MATLSFGWFVSWHIFSHSANTTSWRGADLSSVLPLPNGAEGGQVTGLHVWVWGRGDGRGRGAVDEGPGTRWGAPRAFPATVHLSRMVLSLFYWRKGVREQFGNWSHVSKPASAKASIWMQVCRLQRAVSFSVLCCCPSESKCSLEAPRLVVRPCLIGSAGACGLLPASGSPAPSTELETPPWLLLLIHHLTFASWTQAFVNSAFSHPSHRDLIIYG